MSKMALSLWMGNIRRHFRSEWMNMSMHVHVQWPIKSLESKWGVIKHNENKFGDVYNVIISLNERNSNLDTPYKKHLNSTSSSTLKDASIVCLHCWLLLHDMPTWFNKKVKKTLSPPMKHEAQYFKHWKT